MIGQRWAIHWLDPSGHVGAELDEVKLFLCITEGKLVKLTKTMLVIQSSIYPDSQTGDFTAIHRSLVVDYQKLWKEKGGGALPTPAKEHWKPRLPVETSSLKVPE